MKYHIWTSGCQMNVADSLRVSSSLEQLGYSREDRVENADIIVLNTCVVRKSAEDRAYGRLNSLLPLKRKRPDLVINLMGCLVGVKGHEKLKEQLPMVDVFSPPSDPGPLISFLTQSKSREMNLEETSTRHRVMDRDLILPVSERGKLISSFVPVVMGCSHACTFCIIPYRRGVEYSRSDEEIISETRALVSQGVKEITYLGQIVDRYGMDLPDGPDLSGLLRRAHAIEGLERIRFLTSHPNWMTDQLLETVAELPKLMPHIEVPVQAGDDQVLKNMKRGYTSEDYRRLVHRIRAIIPDGSIATDVIVGFPGETRQQFERTYDLLAQLKMDVAHIARYSSRKGTVAERRLVDDVSEDEKWERFRALETLQERIADEINQEYLGKEVDVLFEEKLRGRWKGRTPTNKLVFVDSEEDLRGKQETVLITWTGPWSMQGKRKELKLSQPDMVSITPTFK